MAHKKNKTKIPANLTATTTLADSDSARRENLFHRGLILLLLGLGAYHSVIYFGHQPIPNPDFHDFVVTGNALWSWHLPGSFKRAPLIGTMLVGFGKLLPQPHPELTAGWLINAILHPFNLALIYLVARRLVGFHGFWIALIAGMNPWNLHLIQHPIAETPMLCTLLAACWLADRRSGWAYVFAALTSAIRYEGAILILAVMVVDILHAENRKQKIRPLIKTALASIPFVVWMIITALCWDKSRGHYLTEFGHGGHGDFALTDYLAMSWAVIIAPLCSLPPGISESLSWSLMLMTKIIAVAGFVIAAGYGLYKKNSLIIIFLIFGLSFLLIHSLHGFVFPRFVTTVAWMLIIMIAYSWQIVWAAITKIRSVSRPIIITAHLLLSALWLTWLISLAQHLHNFDAISPKSVYLPHLTLLAILLAAAAFLYARGFRRFTALLTVTLMVIAILLSNHYRIVGLIGRGQQDIEFKLLAEWFEKNASPGDRLATSLPETVKLFISKSCDDVCNTSQFRAESPLGFAENCRQAHITYVAWDSRTGLGQKNDMYYFRAFNNIEMLVKPETAGPFQFVTRIKNPSGNNYINIFRLKPPL